MSNHTAELREGINEAGVITKVVSLGWFDGPVDGLLQIGAAGSIYRFELVDERQQAEDCDVRAYALFPMPADSLKKLADHLAASIAPRWPVWAPVWKFPTPEAEVAATALTQSLIQQAGRLAWIVVGAIGDGSIRAIPVALSKAS